MTLQSEHVSVSVNLWIRTNIFGIFWWWGQNIFRISLCHVWMMWKIFFHITWMKVTKWMKSLDESWTSMNFCVIIANKQIVWLKDLTCWNVWMKLIPKQLCQMKTTCIWIKFIKWMKYLNECEAWMNFLMIIKRRWII
jgi:hypothetical protein